MGRAAAAMLGKAFSYLIAPTLPEHTRRVGINRMPKNAGDLNCGRLKLEEDTTIILRVFGS